MNVVLDTWGTTTYDPAAATDLEWVEQQIVDHLRAYQQQHPASPLAAVLVDHFPDDPHAWRLVQGVGAVLVTFHEEHDVPESLTVDEVVQAVEDVWAFSIVMKSLGWAMGAQSAGNDPGAYKIVRALQRALMGFQIPGFTQMTSRGVRFVKRDKEGGVWYYEARFGHTTILVNEHDEPPFPPLTAVAPRTLAKVSVTNDYVVDQFHRVDLGVPNVHDVVAVDGISFAPLHVGSDYTVDAAAGRLTFTLAPGARVRVSFAFVPSPAVPDPLIHGVDFTS